MFFCLTLDCFVLGCCGHSRGYPAPSPSNLLLEVQKNNLKARTLRAKAKADQLTGQGRAKVTVYLLVKRPGKLRFEATVMDNTVAVLTSDGESFSSIDFKKHIAYQGPASPCNIARIFQIPLDSNQVAMVLLGGTPILKHDSILLEWDRRNGREVLILSNRSAQLTQKIFVKKVSSSWRVTGSVIKNHKGKTLFKLTFRRMSFKSGKWFPRWIHFIRNSPKADIIIRLDRVDLDVDLPDRAFVLVPPPNLPVHYLTCPYVQLPFMQSEQKKPHPPRKPLPKVLPPGKKAEPPAAQPEKKARTSPK